MFYGYIAKIGTLKSLLELVNLNTCESYLNIFQSDSTRVHRFFHLFLCDSHTGLPLRSSQLDRMFSYVFIYTSWYMVFRVYILPFVNKSKICLSYFRTILVGVIGHRVCTGSTLRDRWLLHYKTSKRNKWPGLCKKSTKTWRMDVNIILLILITTSITIWGCSRTSQLSK